MTVRADVVDIATDSPSPSDRIVVDSCVWYPLTYSGITAAEGRRFAPYGNYLKKLRTAGGTALISAVSFVEVAKKIEHVEFDKYRARTGYALDAKAARSEPAHWATVTSEIDVSWKQMHALGTSCASSIGPSCVSNAAAGLRAGELLDGGDAIIVADARREGVDLVLTDDSDYGTLHGIRVLTALPRLLTLARSAGRLVPR